MLKSQQNLEIHLLHRTGHSIRSIRRITHHDRKTIRNVLTAPVSGATSDGEAFGGQPAKLNRSGRRSNLEPFREFLLGEIKLGVCTKKVLSELRSRGFSGSLCSLKRFLHAHQAGRKIWGKERVDPEFNEANNCKDPKFR